MILECTAAPEVGFVDPVAYLADSLLLRRNAGLQSASGAAVSAL